MSYNNNYNRNNKKGKNYGNNYRNKNSFTNNNSYVGAPYNFVPVSSRVMAVKSDNLIGHDQIKSECYTGEILYEITNEMPIFIGQRNDSSEFYKDNYGRYCIPGSSIRGMIKSNVQILGFSSIVDDVDDYRLMYREVGGKKSSLKETYTNILGIDSIAKISVLKNVKAGYIKKENGKYYIYGVKQKPIDSKVFGEMNYYIVSEKTIYEKYEVVKKKNFEYLVKKGVLQNEMKPFSRKEKNGRTHYEGKRNDEYLPYFMKISYDLSRTRTISGIAEPDKLSRKGYVISSGYMNEKKVFYVIPEIDCDEKFEIPEEDIKAYNVDFKHKEKQLGKGKEYFDLPKDDKIKPVFYISIEDQRDKNKDRLYFGFTPRLRLFYKNTIHDGISREQRDNKLDMAKSMFGYSNNNISFKSKISFSDAILICDGQDATEKIEREVLLQGPKASSYNDYLVQIGQDVVTYNNDKFSIRGMKQYWLRDEIYNDIIDKSKQKNMISTFKPIKKGNTFIGRIRFENLTKEEFGLLLWSIRLEENSRMNIGKGKPLGYGRIKMIINNVSLVDAEKAYKADTLILDPYTKVDNINKYIDDYKNYVKDRMQIDDIMSNPSIYSFFLMKDSTKIPSKSYIRYMDINNHEYQNRKPLPSAEDVVKKHNN